MIADADHLAALLRAASLGDHVAFAELYRLSSGRLFAVARRLLRDPDAASDALQEAYVRIWSQAARFDPEKGQAAHWMTAILRHVCIDVLRRDAVRPQQEAIDVEAADLAIRPPEATGIDLARCLDALSEEQRKAIIMAFHFGLSHAELAGHFNVPLGTMKSTIRRGLGRLKTCLEMEPAHG